MEGAHCLGQTLPKLCQVLEAGQTNEEPVQACACMIQDILHFTSDAPQSKVLTWLRRYDKGHLEGSSADSWAEACPNRMQYMTREMRVTNLVRAAIWAKLCLRSSAKPDQ